jgi:hypothetical protein
MVTFALCNLFCYLAADGRRLAPPRTRALLADVRGRPADRDGRASAARDHDALFRDGEVEFASSEAPPRTISSAKNGHTHEHVDANQKAQTIIYEGVANRYDAGQQRTT